MYPQCASTARDWSRIALITLLIAALSPAADSAVLPATIDSDMTLTAADSPWLMRSDVLIATGADVTVEPNVHVIAEGDWRLTVSGSLTAMAPMGSRIVFRAPDIGASGAWKGLFFTQGSTGRFQRCTFRSATTNLTVSGADVRLYNCHIRNASEDGLMALGDAFVKAAYCRFQNNARHGLQIQTSRPEGAIIFSQFIGSGEHPVRVKAGCLQMLRRGNTYEYNGVNALGVDCDASSDIADSDSWRTQDLPLDMTVGSPNAELVIEESAALRIKPGIRIYPPRRIVVRGRLLVDGLPDAPVVIQPKGDAAAGAWAGISLEPGAVVRMNQATVGHAEDGFRADDARVYLRDALIRDCSRNGIYAGGSAHVDLAAVTISACGRNGVAIPQGTSSAKIHSSSIVECGDYPVRLAATVAEALREGNSWRDNARQAIGVVCAQDIDISDDDTWLAQGIPFDLTADPDATTLSIGTGGRLSIREGVRVHGGTLRAAGVLVASGTPERPVIFDAANPDPTPGDWIGIEYAPRSSGRLVNAVIRNAQIGVNVQSDGWIQLRDSMIRQCAEDGIRAGGDSVPLITGCTVRDNGRWGVSVYHNAEPLLGASGSSANPGLNSLVDNAEYDLANQTGRAIVAQRNWWGHSAQAEIGARILDRSEDPSLGPVNFTPFLDGPPAAGSGAVAGSSVPLAVMSVAAVEAGGGAAIHVALSRPADVRIVLRNIAGRTVRIIDTRADTREIVTWDGYDLRGSRVPSGRYMVEVEAFAETGERSRALTSLALTR
ncbi:MAG: right-handed parallel beta-helix repeat-containing protein [Armatimonadota bacterium]